MTNAESFPVDWVRGDDTRLSIPAHSEAFRAAGIDFLNQAFHAFGSLAPGNRITRIKHLETCPGGSTGHKLFLSVDYDQPSAGLHTELFVKFSRDFTSAHRDKGRFEMETEARFAAISRRADFPIKVPTAYFGDYHAESGTGLLITERLAFGVNGVELQREKCLDHELADPLAYYRAIVTSLARLAGRHKSGRLSPDIDARFPYDPATATQSDPIPYTEAQLRDQIAKYADFVAKYPQLFPSNLRSPAFFTKVDREVIRLVQFEQTIKRFMQSNRDLIALCHWNANIDNAWFWRDEAGTLQCGLMDWGRVRQLNVAFALWGCLLGAPLDLWNRNLDELIGLFCDEFHAEGGPRLDAGELKLHMDLYIATMAMTRMMDAPEKILLRLPEAVDAVGPLDPVFKKNETARNYLHISTIVLNLWQRHDFGAGLDRMLQGAKATADI
jgi:hypothetical protein